ncbi:RNA polymerase sigma factor [Negadavirga shengliensis]|uniref:RNA polymerase sigma factor n=1 Tax=Negadavirga shengliensis TaxID=1389218 RepID=A0ABV9SXN4_9BACT
MKNYRTHNDQELLLLIKDREDHRAFEEIYHRHFNPIFRYVYKIMQDKETAEDLVQNIFFDLWKNHAVHGIQALRPYLFGAARNQIAKEIRRNRWNKEQLAFLENTLGVRSTDEYIAELETRLRIETVTDRLPEKCRNVFELSRYKQLSNKEIAQKLGISVFTVENHIKKALYHLRQSIELVVILFLLK